MSGERAAGLLLHPTSLPWAPGSGDLGPAARAFAEWLAAAGQSWWQMLPMVPTGPTPSPYDSPSSFAGNPAVVSLDDLAAEGLLERSELAAPPWSPERVSFDEHPGWHASLLRRAFERFRARGGAEHELGELRARERWLEGWTSFSALKAAHGEAPWTSWPDALRRRDPDELARVRRELADEIAFHEFVQLCFDRQWRRLADHCHHHGVCLMGDVPMFVAHDSADVWCAPDQFHLDALGRPTSVAGVPPDAFSATGQLWGNPLYRWDVMQARGFDWWLDRLGVTLARFDAVRLDHFIGFRRHWQVAPDATDARSGRFVHVPGEAFFETVERRFQGLPFIAEDLGLLTEEVHALRDRFSLPGMRVLMFGFDTDEPNDYRPHRYVKNCVAYTGTHDNDTLVGWLGRISPAERERVLRYVGSSGAEPHWDVLRGVLASVASLVVFPLQDVLGLGNESRMNVPGTTEGNWAWRARAEWLTPENARRLRQMCHDYERTPRPHHGNANAFVAG